VPHLNDAELATRLKRTLAPWRIRRMDWNWNMLMFSSIN
jgi:hypothetical protein